MLASKRNGGFKTKRWLQCTCTLASKRFATRVWLQNVLKSNSISDTGLNAKKSRRHLYWTLRYSQWGARTCSKCPSGKYQDEEKQSECKKCPDKMTRCNEEGLTYARSATTTPPVPLYLTRHQYLFTMSTFSRLSNAYIIPFL